MKTYSLLIATGIVLASLCSAAAADTTDMFLQISAKKQASLGDGCKAVAALLGTADADKLAPADAVKKLQGLGMLPATGINDAGAPLTRGQLAYMVCKACDVKGGLSLMLFGMSERYAYKECIYLNLMARGPGGRFVSGSELMAVTRRAGAYMDQKNIAPRPAAAAAK